MFIAITILLFLRFCVFLIETWNYKAKMKRQNNGFPKAHYPTLHKPNFFQKQNLQKWQDNQKN